MKECFVEKNFTAAHLTIIDDANDIIDEYEADGYTLTLRQLYYQFVARGLIANKQTEYKRLGGIINEARLAGLVSWEAIEDRTRNLTTWVSYDDPADALERTANRYAEELWNDQPTYCEVWVEKEALAGVVERICSKHRVPFFACRGYVSQSELWRAGKRLEDIAWRRPVHIFHLGDHDPSGIDMTRDNRDRLNMFSDEADISVNRLALNMDQIEEYNPPPNPAKLTDSRIGGYISEYGYQSWELDALEPSVLDRLISANVNFIKDEDLWADSRARQEANRDKIRAFIAQLEDGGE